MRKKLFAGLATIAIAAFMAIPSVFGGSKGIISNSIVMAAAPDDGKTKYSHTWDEESHMGFDSSITDDYVTIVHFHSLYDSPVKENKSVVGDSIVIPSKIENKPVKVIGASAFASVTIESYARDWEKNVTIYIPSSVTNIGDNSFDGLSNIYSFKIWDGNDLSLAIDGAISNKFESIGDY